MEPIEIAGLTPAERAFLLDSGERVVVRITRAPTPDQRFIAMKVVARLVQADGTTVQVGDTPAVAPGWVRSISADGLATGVTTIQAEMAAATVEACERARRHAAALRAWAVVPAG